LDTLLSVDQAARRLGTSVRFVRRLVFERRIAYVKLGRHIRIATRDLDAFRLFSPIRGCLEKAYVTARRSLSTVPAA
jgi:excisionase family DNA binding protein